MKKVFVIVGPTSSGKTTLALELCKKFAGSVVSADSRQIYKFMDIGTGKLPVAAKYKISKSPEKWFLDEIAVWGYDLVNPGQYFSAYDFAGFARKTIQRLLKEQKTVFLVGGTGFYTDITTGIQDVAQSEPDFKLRNKLEAKSLPSLRSTLASLNLEVFERIDKENKVRLVRAIEKEISQKTRATPLPLLSGVQFEYIGLTTIREDLYKKADNWLETVWVNGLLTETENLLKLGFGATPQLAGLIYKSVVACLNGTLTQEQAKERAKFDLHAYVRRQLTWFKRNKQITWFDISNTDFLEKVSNFVQINL